MGVFELNRICLETLRYPSRKVRVTELGLYSTFENAYEKLQELVVESKKEKEECEKEGDKDYAYAFTFGYSIHEKQLDVLYGDTISVRTYTRDGTLNDECIWKDEKGTDLLPFYGRPKEKIRFKAGDIVEVYMYGNVELSIISSLPWTPQEIEKRNKKLEEKHGKGYTLTLDSTDDCYLAHSLGLGNTHFHPSCTDIFAPLKKIPATIRRKLQAKLLEESFTFGYSLQISELPFSKDAKVLDELLNGWDKFIEAKYYTGMECLVDYGNPDNIKAQLDFSKEQSQRFEHFFDVCVRLVNEKRKNV